MGAQLQRFVAQHHNYTCRYVALYIHRTSFIQTTRRATPPAPPSICIDEASSCGVRRAVCVKSAPQCSIAMPAITPNWSSHVVLFSRCVSQRSEIPTSRQAKLLLLIAQNFSIVVNALLLLLLLAGPQLGSARYVLLYSSKIPHGVSIASLQHLYRSPCSESGSRLSGLEPYGFFVKFRKDIHSLEAKTTTLPSPSKSRLWGVEKINKDNFQGPPHTLCVPRLKTGGHASSSSLRFLLSLSSI